MPAGSARDRFKFIQARLAELHTAFETAFNADYGEWYPLAELDGMPNDTLSRLRVGEGENHSEVWLPFKEPDLITALRSVKKADTRKTIYVGSQSKGESKGEGNAQRFKKTLVLRDELARLLQYANFAELRMKDNMAKSLTVV